MSEPALPRILVVDDEEAILETMTFTFMDEYEVLTSTDARKALDLLDENAPVAVVITDQRMPNMTGAEFLAEVYARHPETVRIILTGFADMEATVQAINAGHIYAYVTKPWEPDQLKQVVKRAAEHHALTLENTRLLEDLRRANMFLEAVMDRLGTGAIALDSGGLVQAANRPCRQYLQIEGDPRGQPINEILKRRGLERLGDVVRRVSQESGGSFEEVELKAGGTAHRLRVSAHALTDDDGSRLGQVLQFREISHEPIQRRFDEILASIAVADGDLRPRLEQATEELQSLAADVHSTGIASPGMAELAERASRAQTAVQNWLDVDELLAREDYPDAQLLRDRLRVANERWPAGEEFPPRVLELAQAVEAYYESGENSKQRVL
jgi:CheY-like chemotaxis protein